MYKCLFLYCMAALLNCKAATAQHCHPDAIQQHIRVFWDRFKLVDTIPSSFTTNSNKLYRMEEKQFFFMGSFHSPDTAYPLYRKIDSVMAALNPDIVLVENYYAIEDKDINTAVSSGADVGYVSYVASTRNIRVKSWDNVPAVYNQLIPVYGYDKALVMLLNSVGDFGLMAQSGEDSYAQFLNSFQLGGGILTSAQQSYAYYQQIFQQYYKCPLLHPGDTGYAEQQTAIQHHQGRKQFDSRFTQLRDRRLLQAVQTELPVYNKIYLQAGAAHFQSLKDVIPCYLKPVKPAVKPIVSKKNLNKHQLLMTAGSVRNKDQQIMISYTNYKDSSTGQMTRIEKQIRQFAPDIILTSSPGLISRTRDETFARSGISGYTRFLAIDEKITLDQWPPSWGDVYHHFIKRYSNEELYLTCFAMNILQDGEFHTIEDFRDKFFDAGNKMRLAEYPFRDNQFDFDVYICKIVKNEPRHAYTLEEILSFIRKKTNKVLEEEIKKYQIISFFTTPFYGLQNLTQKKIFIQMDEGYRSYLK